MIPHGLLASQHDHPDLLPAALDAPCADILPLCRPYLTAMHAAPDLARSYHALWDGPRPVALVALHHLDLAPARTISWLAAAPRSAHLRRAVGWALHHTNTRAVLCGDPFIPGIPGWWRAPDLPEPALLRWIASLMAQASRRGAALQIFKDLPLAATPLAALRFRPHESDPVMLMTLRPSWRHLDDYLSDLHKKYRQTCKKTRAQTSNIMRRELSCDEIKARREELWTLHQNVLSSADFSPVTFGIHTFHSLAQHLGPHYKIYGYFEEERMVAFNTQLICADMLISHSFGMTSRQTRAPGLYLRILLDDLSDAIDARMHTLHLGRGASSIKSALGALPLHAPTLIRHRHPLGQLAQRPLSSLLAPAPWTPRHPLKPTP